jgi:hypothetical protein
LTRLACRVLSIGEVGSTQSPRDISGQARLEFSRVSRTGAVKNVDSSPTLNCGSLRKGIFGDLPASS